MSPNTGNSVLHPSDGIRLLLERDSMTHDKESAVYRGVIYTTTTSFSYRATLRMDGLATLEATQGEAREVEREQLMKIAKSIARSAKRKLGEGLPPWPPRILRWRGPR